MCYMKSSRSDPWGQKANMKIFVQHEDRGNITLIWRRDAGAYSHAASAAPRGYHTVEVDVPPGNMSLEHIQEHFRVHVEHEHAVLVAK